MAYNFYNVLLVNQNATLDEIKLAFKKRALQVHPDKGGSKEAFHLVYQALETLADPLARRKYDNGLAASKPTVVQHPPQKSSRRKKKTSKKRAQPAERKQARSKAKKTQKPKSEPKTASHTQAGPEAPKARQSQEAKLLTKIHALLKLLPRDVRKDMITNHFSQKQRLTLENWMFDNSQQAKAEPGTQEVALALPFVEGEDRSAKPATRAAAIQDQAASLDNSCADVAAPAIDSLSPRRRKPRIWRQARHRMIRDKNAESKPKTRKPCGFVTAVKRGSAYYKATIRFDALDIHTGQCDLQTALEYLVILTSAKQKMLDSTNTHAGAFFEGRLQEALASAASEQGKNVADLKLRFSVLQSLGFVVGNGFQLHSPVVRTIQELSKLRSCFEPFRQYSRKWGRRSAVWRYSPAHLEDAWERLQKATASAWESAGADSTKFMQKMRDCYNANASFRHRQLQYWERQQMASQDKNNYRPRRLQQRSTKRMELWERQHMAKHDKNKHRPKKLQDKSTKSLEQRERLRMSRQDKNKHRPKGLRDKGTSCLERRERQQMAMEDRNRHRPWRLRVSSQESIRGKKLSRSLSALKTLLVRWEHLLNKQEQTTEKEHRKALRLRKLQQKKDTEKRKRQEVLNQKRVREEERLRRENLRKRMKSSDFMDNIPWI